MSAKDTASIEVEPFIPASTVLPEITFRALFLGCLLAVVLTASTTFVGLKIARTIAGSIPAALISMLVLRRFRNANILENNMVQTIASAGETVAAGVIFTLPALVIIGYWSEFNYFQTALITMIGGILGVFFSVPLRRHMMVKEKLPYPEGLAIGEVLKAGEGAEKGSTKVLVFSSFLAAGLSFLQGGFRIAGEHIQYWTRAGSSAFGASIMLSPVLMAAGYIVGMRGLIALAVGGFLTWCVAIPIFVSVHGLPEAADLASSLGLIRKNHFVYVGVGVLVVGGLWSVISITKQISGALSASFKAMRAHQSEFDSNVRTDRDIPFQYVILGVVLVAVPALILFFTLVRDSNLQLSSTVFWALVLLSTVFSMVMGFIAAAIAAYIVGMVGTTSLPVSGISIAAIAGFSAVLLILLKGSINFSVDANSALKIAGIVVIFSAIICVSASMSGDNMQDLKAGQIVGATPWKQQAMLAVGVVVSALVIPYILQTTFQAYGLGDILPRAGMDPAQALPAPQATIMATLVQGIFFVGKELPWDMISGGVALGILAIIMDEFLRRRQSKIRFPVLLFALGIYLPLGYVTAFFLGGIVRSIVDWRKGSDTVKDTDHGILCASGIIAGEAILGALLTIPFAYAQRTDVFALNIAWLNGYETFIGLVLFLALCGYLYKQGTK